MFGIILTQDSQTLPSFHYASQQHEPSNRKNGKSDKTNIFIGRQLCRRPLDVDASMPGLLQYMSDMKYYVKSVQNGKQLGMGGPARHAGRPIKTKYIYRLTPHQKHSNCRVKFWTKTLVPPNVRIDKRIATSRATHPIDIVATFFHRFASLCIYFI